MARSISTARRYPPPTPGPGGYGRGPQGPIGTGVVVEWGAIRGRIEAPLPDTTFTCLVGGNQAVTLTASDGKCDEVATFSVFCVSPTCGDGRLDPGEQCDPPNGTTCLDGCSLPCGDGLIEPGEQCDPPDGTTCSASCRFLNPAYD